MKYHSKGISKNKAIRKERNKPIPLELMCYEKIDRDGVIDGGSKKTKYTGKNVFHPEDDDKGHD